MNRHGSIRARAEGERLRADFVARAHLQPPDVLRLIDIQATCKTGQVTLQGYKEVLQLHADDHVTGSSIGYSAISHTFGMEVYSIFDCKCTSTLSHIANIPPRYWDKPCPHFTGKDDEARAVRDRVVSDILEMCHILSRAGVRYAWHDGVCIAQYDASELTAVIKSIGWIYAAAKETVVFLHYVGKPMAPIAPRGCGYELACRWHTRVWTFQEAALSKSRRYCVRVSKTSLHFNRLSGNAGTLKEFEKNAKEFEEKASQWYEKHTSEVDVITEEKFLEIINEVLGPLQGLWEVIRTFKALLEEVGMQNGVRSQQLAACVDSWYACIQIWSECLEGLRSTLDRTCSRFPELGAALVQCSRRDSKHVGDRINSVLTLAGLKNLVAPKDFENANDSMEAWTLKFFEEQGPRGLAWAVLSTNEGLAENKDIDKITHSWVPLLWRPLSGPRVGGYECNESWGIQFRVCKDGKLELTGKMLCVAVTFRLKLKEEEDDARIQELYEKAHGSGHQALDDKANFTDTHELDAIFGEGEREDHSEYEVDTDTDLSIDTYCDDEADEGNEEEEVDQAYPEEVLDTYCDNEVDQGNGDEEEVDDQAYAEELFDPEASSTDHNLETDVGQHEDAVEMFNDESSNGASGSDDDDEKQRMVMDILSISMDGSHGFDARLPGAKPGDIMGMVTFFPLQVLEEGEEDGRVIGGHHIMKEGDSLHACLVAPLHYDWIVSSVQPGFLIITDLLLDHDRHTTASKIGIFAALKSKAQDVLRSAHLASKIINRLVIN